MQAVRYWETSDICGNLPLCNYLTRQKAHFNVNPVLKRLVFLGLIHDCGVHMFNCDQSSPSK